MQKGKVTYPKVFSFLFITIAFMGSSLNSKDASETYSFEGSLNSNDPRHAYNFESSLKNDEIYTESVYIDYNKGIECLSSENKKIICENGG